MFEGKRFLVVDDEVQIVKLVTINLQKAFPGAVLETAFDGADALEKIKANKPDLVIMDVMMPRVNGWDALKALQTEPETQDLPVIMLTAKAQDVDIVTSWEHGAFLHLTKPFNPRELIEFVTRILTYDPNNELEEESGKTYEV